MKKWLKQLDEVVYRIERVLIVAALTVMALVVFLQVVLRFWDQGFPWAEELARYLMIWAGFLGASIATRQRRHLKVDILSRFLSPDGQAKDLVTRLTSLISAGFCFFLVSVGYEFVANSYKYGRTSSSLKLPIWLVQLSIPLTMFIIACRFLGQAFGDIPEESDIDRILEQEGQS